MLGKKEDVLCFVHIERDQQKGSQVFVDIFEMNASDDEASLLREREREIQLWDVARRKVWGKLRFRVWNVKNNMLI